jgi:VWFA-related protein
MAPGLFQDGLPITSRRFALGQCQPGRARSMRGYSHLSWCSSRRHREGLATGVIAAVALLSHSPESRQLLRTSVNVVLVDMRALNENAQVGDLRADELTLLIDGVPRPIVSLAYYPAGQASLEKGEQAAKNIADAQAPSRRVVLIVDRKSIPSGEGTRVLKAAQEFIREAPVDYSIAVAMLPLEGDLNFETNRDVSVRAVADALRRTSSIGQGLEGTAGFGCTGTTASAGCGDQGLPLPGGALGKARDRNSAAETQLRASTLLRDLQRLFHALRDGPSDVILLTGGLPRSESLRAEIDRTIESARVSRVRVHTLTTLDATDVGLSQGTSPDGNRPMASPMTVGVAYGLPVETGGIEQTGATSGSAFFAQVARDLTGSYLLAFEPLPQDRDGRPHRIEVTTSRRPPPTIRARKVFVIEPTPLPAEGVRLAAGSSAPDTLTTAGSETKPRAPSASDNSAGVLAANAAPESSGSPTTAEDSLRALLGRASAYVEHFQKVCAAMVAEEQYVQVLKIWIGTPPAPDTDPELEWKAKGDPEHGGRRSSPVRRRQLLSDMLLVQAPGQTWVGYRDVAEVDGEPIRDRTARVQRLFLSAHPEDRRQLDRIAAESARFNIGTDRTLNLPTFPLQTVLASTTGHFLWTRYPDELRDAGCCAIVGLREVKSPTLVRTWDDHDIPVTGRLWIEPRTGRVTRATLQFGGPISQVEGAVDVTYGATPNVDVLVPRRLWEWIRRQDQDHLGRPVFVEGRATYTDIRRFTVNTQETVKTTP